MEAVVETLSNSSSRLTFGHVEIHEFGAAIGHNPSVSQGVPIALSDEPPLSSKRMPLESYERIRPPRRTTRQLVISKNVRAEILLQEGYSVEEIEEATKVCLRKRTDRRKSYQNKSWDGVTEKLESTKRQLSKIVKRRYTPPKDELRRMLDITKDTKGDTRFLAGTDDPIKLKKSARLRRSVSVDSPVLIDPSTGREPLKIPVRRKSFINLSKQRSSESSPTKPERRASGMLLVDDDPAIEPANTGELNPSPRYPLSLDLHPEAISPHMDDLYRLSSDSFDHDDLIQEQMLKCQPRANFDNTPAPQAVAHVGRNAFCNALTKNELNLPFADDDRGPTTFGAGSVRRLVAKSSRKLSDDGEVCPRMPERRQSVECGRLKKTGDAGAAPRRRKRSSFFNGLEEPALVVSDATPSSQIKKMKERRNSFFGTVTQKFDRNYSQNDQDQQQRNIDADTVIKQAVTVKVKRRDSLLSGIVARRGSFGITQSTIADKTPSTLTLRARRRSSFFGGSENPSMTSTTMRDSFQRCASDSSMGVQNPFRRCRVVLDDAHVALEYEPMYMPGDSDDFTSEELVTGVKSSPYVSASQVPSSGDEDMKAASNASTPINSGSPEFQLPIRDNSPADPVLMRPSFDLDTRDLIEHDDAKLDELQLDSSVPSVLSVSPAPVSVSLISDAGRRCTPEIVETTASCDLTTPSPTAKDRPTSILKPSKYAIDTCNNATAAPKAKRRSSLFGSNHGNRSSSDQSPKSVMRMPQRLGSDESITINASNRPISDQAPQPIPRRRSFLGATPKNSKQRSHSLEPHHGSQQRLGPIDRASSPDILKMPARRVSLAASHVKVNGSVAEQNQVHDIHDRAIEKTHTEKHQLLPDVASNGAEKSEMRTERRGSFFGLGSNKQSVSHGSQSSFASFHDANDGSGTCSKKTERRGSFLGLSSIKRTSSNGSQSSFATFDSGNGPVPAKATRRGSFLGIGKRRLRSDPSNASFVSNDDGGYMVAPSMARAVSDVSQSSFASFDGSSHFFLPVSISSDNQTSTRSAPPSQQPRQLSLSALIPVPGRAPINFAPKSDAGKQLSGDKPRRRNSFFGYGKPATKKPSYLVDGSSRLASMDASDWSTDLEPSFPDDSARKKKGNFLGLGRPPPVAHTTSNDSFASCDGSCIAVRPQTTDYKDTSKFSDSYSTVAISETPSNSGLSTQPV